MAEPVISLTIELPQNIYDEIMLMSRRQVRTVNDTVADVIRAGLNCNPSGDMYPDYPLGPAPEWDYNRMKK